MRTSSQISSSKSFETGVSFSARGLVGQCSVEGFQGWLQEHLVGGLRYKYAAKFKADFAVESKSVTRKSVAGVAHELVSGS